MREELQRTRMCITKEKAMQYQLEEKINQIPEDEYNRETQVKLWTEWWVENLNKYDLHYLEEVFVQGEKNRKTMPDLGYSAELVIIRSRIESHADVQEFEFAILGGLDRQDARKAAEYALTLLKVREWTS
tara:strand:- start:361 stop:750 length:390 start_codon:yes stop_codon:yes gene_type:complete